jgi:hypothetical protein
MTCLNGRTREVMVNDRIEYIPHVTTSRLIYFARKEVFEFVDAPEL